MRAGFLELCLLPGGELAQVCVDVLQGAVFGDELGGAHFAHAVYAGHVVCCIATNGQHVNHLRGLRDAPLGAELGHAPHFCVRSAFAGFVLETVRADELAVVLVRRHHVHVQLGRCVLRGYRPQHVIGLKAGNHDHGNVHRLYQLRKRLQGLYHQLRGRGARAFIGRIQLVAEGAARRIKSHGNVRGLFLLQQLQQVLGESVEDGHVRPLGIDHGTAQEGVVHFEHQRMAVDEKQFVHSLQRYELFS